MYRLRRKASMTRCQLSLRRNRHLSVQCLYAPSPIYLVYFDCDGNVNGTGRVVSQSTGRITQYERALLIS